MNKRRRILHLEEIPKVMEFWTQDSEIPVVVAAKQLFSVSSEI
jgi:hypothetical protein